LDVAKSDLLDELFHVEQFEQNSGANLKDHGTPENNLPLKDESYWKDSIRSARR
jgi:hypothetical protein